MNCAFIMFPLSLFLSLPSLSPPVVLALLVTAPLPHLHLRFLTPLSPVPLLVAPLWVVFCLLRHGVACWGASLSPLPNLSLQGHRTASGAARPRCKDNWVVSWCSMTRCKLVTLKLYSVQVWKVWEKKGAMGRWDSLE